jgi:DNA-directed RNA polymerase subunit RPC12/RpoP
MAAAGMNKVMAHRVLSEQDAAGLMHVASLFAAGKKAVASQLSADVLALTQGVLKTMLLTKLKIVTAALLVTAVVGIGAARPILGACLQNDAKDFEAWKSPVVFGEGFFGVEKSKESTWRWIGDRLSRAEGPVPLKGVVHLQNSKKDSVLTIAGIVPTMPARPTIKVFLSGELLDEFTAFKDQFEVTYNVPAAKQGQEEFSELLISVDKFIIPSERNKNSQDERRLAIRLTKLTWGEHRSITRPAEPPIPEAPAVEVPPDVPRSRWFLAFLGSALVLFALLLSLAVYLGLRVRKTSVAAGAGARANDEDGEAPISFSCSSCGQPVKAKAEWNGKKVKCPHCRQTVLVAGPSPAPRIGGTKDNSGR